MSGITLDMFLREESDLERCQYAILEAIRAMRQEFSGNRIYPHLGDLVEIYQTLQSIEEKTADLKKILPRTLKDVDWESGELVYDLVASGKGHELFFEELIHWALPLLQELIEEGRAIFEFVDENMHVEEVGVVPSYIEEGYLFIPDLRLSLLRVIRYQVSLFTNAHEPYRRLKTSEVRSAPLRSLRFSPSTIKLDLMQEYRDMPNPATYIFATDLDFPFENTIFPVAKRKLLRYLYS